MPHFNHSQKALVAGTSRPSTNRSIRRLSLLDPQGRRSIFSSELCDALPEHYQVFREELTQLRAAMREFLVEHGFHLPRPSISSIWSARTAVMAALVALEECGSSSMSCYGDLSPEAAKALDAGLQRLKQPLARLQARLAEAAEKKEKK